jgi:hypothetical protein
MDPLTPMIRRATLIYYDTFNFSQLLAIVYIRLWRQRRGILENQLYSNLFAKMHLCQTLLLDHNADQSPDQLSTITRPLREIR